MKLYYAIVADLHKSGSVRRKAVIILRRDRKIDSFFRYVPKQQVGALLFAHYTA